MENSIFIAVTPPLVMLSHPPLVMLSLSKHDQSMSLPPLHPLPAALRQAQGDRHIAQRDRHIAQRDKTKIQRNRCCSNPNGGYQPGPTSPIDAHTKGFGALFMFGNDRIDFAAICAGDQQAWRQFYRRARPLLDAACSRVLARQARGHDGAALQDCVAACLERLSRDDFRLLKKFDASRGNLKTFLSVVASSTASNWLRDTRQPNAISLDQPIDDTGETPEAGPSIQLEAAEERPWSQSILPLLSAGQLSDRETLILVLSFDKDLDGPEVAQVLGISASSVRVMKARALKKLKASGLAPDGTLREGM